MFTTPGVYFEQVDRSRPGIGTLRTDIPAFLGYSERGPLLAPVKLTGWRQFQAIFGQALATAHLPYAVRGFFENQGAACYVVRIADPQVACPAETTLLDGLQRPCLRLWASHGELHDPVTGGSQVASGHPVRYASPGAWGDRLAISVLPASLGSTSTLSGPAPGKSASLVRSLSGFETGSLVRLSQGAIQAPQLRQIVAIDAVRRMITWDAPLEGLGLDPGDPDQPLRLESMEITLLVLLDGQIVERHAGLSLSSGHSRYLLSAVQAASRYIDVEILIDLPAGQALDPQRWPASRDQQPLAGGQDGLASVDKDDFLSGLEALQAIREISLLAAPDLVLVPERPDQDERIFLPDDPCQSLEPVPDGKLRGVVKVLSAQGDGQPLAGVRVRVLGTVLEMRTSSGPNPGVFQFTGLPIGQVSLLFERQGYYTLEATVQTRSVLPTLPAGLDPFYMTPITLPPALALDDIYEVQAAMLNQGEQEGRYRAALLDPPYSQLGFDEIQTWRARFDSSYAALYYPWLLVDDENGQGVRSVPPSGHVAGLIAHTDLTQGVQRAPANYVLDGVKALTSEVDEARQGILNPQGINCLRVLPGRGIRVYGARTLSSDPEWRYLNVRRLMMMIEASIEQSTQWAVFEPNNQVLRQALTFNIGSFLNSLWRLGALAGTTPEAAYQVLCDDSNNPAGLVDAGQLLAEIAVAPAIPFEFIRFRLGRTEEAIQITE